VTDAATANPYSVRVLERAAGWEVRVLDEGGRVALTRACLDETEARTFASTVQQHIYWLSPERFRHYYRIPGPG
jgi:hypothetical protein